MPSTNLRIERLKTMLGLEEKRSNLQRELDALQKQLSDLKDQLFDDSSDSSTRSSAQSAPPRRGRNQRGALKEQILAALSSAGSAGVRVTELAEALGQKAANIHAWFHSTGKKIPGLTKVSGGHYRLKESSSGSTQGAPSAQPATSASKGSSRKTGGSKAGKGAKRGQLSKNILAALEDAGEEGIKIKDLSDKIGANYRNVSVWFVTTGKNYPKIKKVGAAHYKLAA